MIAAINILYHFDSPSCDFTIHFSPIDEPLRRVDIINKLLKIVFIFNAVKLNKLNCFIFEKMTVQKLKNSKKQIFLFILI
jgi:hypothetical protein